MFDLMFVAMVLLYAAVDLCVIAAAFGVKFSDDLSIRYAGILLLVDLQLSLTLLLLPLWICFDLSGSTWALSAVHLCLVGAGIWLLLTRTQAD